MLRQELGYATDVTYRLLSSDLAEHWDYGIGAKPPGLCRRDRRSAGRARRAAVARVLIAHGRTDLVTPYLASRYLIDQLPPMAGSPADRARGLCGRTHDVHESRLAARAGPRRGTADRPARRPARTPAAERASTSESRRPRCGSRVPEGPRGHGVLVGQEDMAADRRRPLESGEPGAERRIHAVGIDEVESAAGRVGLRRRPLREPVGLGQQLAGAWRRAAAASAGCCSPRDRGRPSAAAPTARSAGTGPPAGSPRRHRRESADRPCGCGRPGSPPPSPRVRRRRLRYRRPARGSGPRGPTWPPTPARAACEQRRGEQQPAHRVRSRSMGAGRGWRRHSPAAPNTADPRPEPMRRLRWRAARFPA